MTCLVSDNLERISNFFFKKNRFFINIIKIWSLIDACYGLKSYERGVAQLGSAGALGALKTPTEKHCKDLKLINY